MKYDKPPLFFEQQADLLISRGLIADKNDLITKLSSVSYFRLSGYFYHFQNKATEVFFPNTEFKTIWKRYIYLIDN